MASTESFQEAFDNVYFFFVKTDLRINDKQITFGPYPKGCRITFPKKERISVDKIKKIIEKYNPKFGYKIKLHPSKLSLFWGEQGLIKFKKRSISVNFYGIGTPKESYDVYKELVKDLILLYEPDAKI